MNALIRKIVLAAIALSVGFGAATAVTGSLALFTASTNVTLPTLSAGYWLSSGARSTSAWDLRDASEGNTAINASDPLSYPADGLAIITSNFDSAFSSSRYVSLDFNAPVASGSAASGVAFNLRVLPNAGGETACWYLEARRASTNALLGSHGSAASPYACVTGTTYTTTSVSLPEVTSTDIANDLRLKVFAKETGKHQIKIDLATVSGGTSYGAFNLYQAVFVNSGNGTPVSTPWSLFAADGTYYTTAHNWNKTFTTARYLLFSFDPDVPVGSTISAVTLTHVYQSTNAADNTCVYLEAYGSGTLIGSHGSAATPLSCATGAGWKTDTVTLAEVNTVAYANSLQIKLYANNSNGHQSNHDRILITITYAHS